ncbi:MAG: ATP-dependent zinc protease [Methyloligella sp. ZOD6]
MHIGWREWVGLPDLGVAAIKAKIDTGARTSAIHAWKIEPFQRGGQVWLRFELHPEQRSKAGAITCEAPAADRRQVRSSGGHVTKRYVIKTTLALGTEMWPIELTLINRDEMGFRMLLGRTALKNGVLIDPARSFLVSADRVPPRRRPRSKPSSG